jgi:hypothetical protein
MKLFVGVGLVNKKDKNGCFENQEMKLFVGVGLVNKKSIENIFILET